MGDAEWADVVVTMGCGDECPFIPGTRYVDWDLPDPKGRPVDEVRALRDRIQGQIDVALPGDVGALVPAAHRHHHIGRLGELAVSRRGTRSARSIPSSRIASTTSGCTRSAGVVPAPTRSWRPPASRSNSASLICERPALWRQTKRAVAIGQRESSGTPTIVSRRVSPPMRELADLLRARAERVPVGSLAVGRGQRLRHRGQQRPQRRPHVLGEARDRGDGLAQEPGAVADVALLVVVDLRVALHEARQQALAVEVAR